MVDTKNHAPPFSGLGHIWIMEKKMETAIVYWGYIGIIEKKNGNYVFEKQMAL